MISHLHIGGYILPYYDTYFIGTVFRSVFIVSGSHCDDPYPRKKHLQHPPRSGDIDW